MAILKQSIYKDSEHRNIKDWLVNKIYFHRISASAITSHGFSTLLLPQPWHMYLRWGILFLRAPLLDKLTPFLPNDKHCTEWYGFTNSDFSKSLWNLVWSYNNPLSISIYDTGSQSWRYNKFSCNHTTSKIIYSLNDHEFGTRDYEK